MVDNVSSSMSDEDAYAQIPSDFPVSIRLGALPGAQPKMMASHYKGHFYMPGSSPPELFERWTVCEDLAQQLATKSLESKAGKRAHLTETEILDQYLSRLIATNWTSEAEAQWVIRRTAELLGWRAPSSVTNPQADLHPRKNHE